MLVSLVASMFVLATGTSSNIFAERMKKLDHENVIMDTDVSRDLLNTNLLDYNSARFKDVRFYDIIVCGYVNSRNAFGGYTGWQRFEIDILEKSIHIDSDQADVEKTQIDFMLCNNLPGKTSPLEPDSTNRLYRK